MERRIPQNCVLISAVCLVFNAVVFRGELAAASPRGFYLGSQRRGGSCIAPPGAIQTFGTRTNRSREKQRGRCNLFIHAVAACCVQSCVLLICGLIPSWLSVLQWCSSAAKMHFCCLDRPLLCSSCLFLASPEVVVGFNSAFLVGS